MRRRMSVHQGWLAGVALLAGCGGTAVEPLPGPFTAIAGGLVHTCGLLGDGSAFCWGNNRYGELGDGSRTGRFSPVAVSGLIKFAVVSPGAGFTCGIAVAGAAYCWGYNFSGQLGDGTHTDHAAPAPVDGASAWRTVSSGGSYACGIAADSTAFCWGWNQYGQLGDSTQVDQSSPTPVRGGHKFVAISSGSFHTCALGADGAAYCWGRNDYGQLGTGDQSLSLVPAAVQGGLTFRSVGTGYGSTCGLAADGTAYCWGENQFGQLGAGDSLLGQSASQPGPVAGGMAWGELHVGAYFACGVQQGAGAVYCWGLNSAGQLGADVPGVCTDENGIPFQCGGAPSAVSGGLTFATITTAAQHACGITADQVAYCWGLDSEGQLGDGRQGPTIVAIQPVKVLGQP